MHFQLTNAIIQVWVFSLTKIQKSFTRMHFSYAFFLYHNSHYGYFRPKILKCYNCNYRKIFKLWKGADKTIFRDKLQEKNLIFLCKLGLVEVFIGDLTPLAHLNVCMWKWLRGRRFFKKQCLKALKSGRKHNVEDIQGNIFHCIPINIYP